MLLIPQFPISINNLHVVVVTSSQREHELHMKDIRYKTVASLQTNSFIFLHLPSNLCALFHRLLLS